MIRRIIRRPYEYSRLALLKQYLQAHGKKDAVFIWIPKTAGTSIYSILRKHGCPKLKSPHLVRYYFPQRGLVTFGHMSYLELVKSGYVSETFDQSSFKFCFARNPFDRAVSLFLYLRGQKVIGQDLPFLAFCRQLRDNGYEGIGLYNTRGLSQCNPQTEWVTGIDLDFVGRVESLEEDVDRVLEILELPATGVPRLNISSHGHYASYYCEQSREIIKELYSHDFQSFGYDIRDV